ncbi:MBL fold metallo-hydrolase [Rathayibacter sp. VKM Ac-2803]|uniref:MBL fold metallo-hydrolase n=1 Tax=unclassified Rathayibacter TaxID=2609250 RepID=UPI0013579F07|nr:MULTISPECIES: MBL fold metallo-hydrolase [unclassified Rathayibacter]MWV47784.1 MBL fold metallo-hydrolase [Rathayibacter sp. VKM Ac-2803]MWV59005.1 MBL fold metallo-hydrolase [Rathayibacter sp. VKM Ac-2754]
MSDARPHRQAVAPPSVPIGEDAFAESAATTLRWLGMAGFLVNTRGTVILIDPVLHGFDMPLLIDVPLGVDDVPRVDAILVTHADNDHFSIPSCRDLVPATTAFHSTRYVASVMAEEGIPGTGHDIGDAFSVGDHVDVTVLPADHAWQNAQPDYRGRVFHDEDSCGFWIRTPDGVVWAPGDSRLIRDHHLTMPEPDVLLFDFSDSEWHFGFDGAVEMANAYPRADLVLHHWGSVDSPEFAPFNGDPATLWSRIVNPSRIRVVAPGESFAVRSR